MGRNKIALAGHPRPCETRLYIFNALLFCFRCRVHGWAFEFALFFPLCAVLFVNFIVYALVIRQLHRAGKMEQNLPTVRQKKQKSATKTNLLRSMTFATLLGLTWVTGLFMIDEATLFLQYLFTVLVSLQGFSIFLLQCVANSTIRRRWKRFLLCSSKPRSKDDTLSVSATTNGTGTLLSTVSSSSLRTQHDHSRQNSDKKSKSSTRFIDEFTETSVAPLPDTTEDPKANNHGRSSLSTMDSGFPDSRKQSVQDAIDDSDGFPSHELNSDVINHDQPVLTNGRTLNGLKSTAPEVEV